MHEDNHTIQQCVKAEPESVSRDPLPEHVKAAQRRKIAKGLDGQSGTRPERDRKVARPAAGPSNAAVKETLVQSVNPPPKHDEASVSVVDSFEPDLLKSITENQARSLVNQIRDHINDARALVLELYEREGWRALGYDSWRECVVAEFDLSQRRLYQLLDAAKVERNICTIVQNTEPIREAVLRPLARLEPDQQREAWAIATAATPNPAAEQVERVAKTLTKAIEDDRTNTQLTSNDARQVDPDKSNAVFDKERELRRRKTITKAFEQAVWFFYPNGNTPEDFAAGLLEYINPELIEREYSKENLDEAIRVFRLIAKGVRPPTLGGSAKTNVTVCSVPRGLTK